MNRYDFTQPGGFPFDQGVCDFIQNNINTAAQTTALAGPTVILVGCIVAGGAASDGFVAINGEILPFVGGILDAKVKIVETPTVIAYQDGTPRTTKFERYATFGDDGVTALLWANFLRDTGTGSLARLNALEAHNVTVDTEIDSLNDDVATLGADVDDLEANTVKKLASGTKVIGDADTNHSSSGLGTTIRVNIGKTLANTNYMALLSVVSLSANPQSDLYHQLNIRAKTTTYFDVYFRLVTPVVQNINLDWTLIAL